MVSQIRSELTRDANPHWPNQSASLRMQITTRDRMNLRIPCTGRYAWCQLLEPLQVEGLTLVNSDFALVSKSVRNEQQSVFHRRDAYSSCKLISSQQHLAIRVTGFVGRVGKPLEQAGARAPSNDAARGSEGKAGWQDQKAHAAVFANTTQRIQPLATSAATWIGLGDPWTDALAWNPRRFSTSRPSSALMCYATMNVLHSLQIAFWWVIGHIVARPVQVEHGMEIRGSTIILHCTATAEFLR